MFLSLLCPAFACSFFSPIQQRIDQVTLGHDGDVAIFKITDFTRVELLLFIYLFFDLKEQLNHILSPFLPR